MSVVEKQLKKKIKWKTIEDSLLNFESINVEDNLRKVKVLEADNNTISNLPEGLNKPKKLKPQPDLIFLYEQMEKDNPVLIENKCFVIADDNNNYFCTLCDTSISTSTKINKLKNMLLVHLHGKAHKKRCVSFRMSKVTMRETTEICCNTKQTIMEDTCVNEIKTDFDSIYDSFNKLDPVVKTSKKYLRKKEQSENYECTLCNQLIFNPLNEKGFKYTLWVHMNENSHKEKLPNFKDIQKKFFTFIKKALRKNSDDFADDVKYFTIGPIFNFIQCTICEVAVHKNVMCLEKHVKREEHRMRKKELKKDKTSDNELSLEYRSHIALKKLSAKIDRQFRADLQYIRKGKVPGYVVCVVCVKAIIATKSVLQKHLNSGSHILNTLADFIESPRPKSAVEPLKKECKKAININEIELDDRKPKAKKLRVALKKMDLKDDYDDDI